MVMDARFAKPEERYPAFEGAPVGWTSWARFRQQKWIDQHPQCLVALNEALTKKNAEPAKAEPVSEVRSQVLPPTPAMMTTAVTSESEELDDIRKWNEPVDGISAERIRNCIIFQLDYKKSKFYREALTEGFIRRTLKSGITGARKLHEDTPPGWTPPATNPLFKIYTVIEDGREIEKKKFRRYETPEEKQELLKYAFTSRGILIDYFISRLVDKDCPECHETGYKEVQAYPDSKKYAHIKKKVLCDCITRIPPA